MIMLLNPGKKKAKRRKSRKAKWCRVGVVRKRASAARSKYMRALAGIRASCGRVRLRRKRRAKTAAAYTSAQARKSEAAYASKGMFSNPRKRRRKARKGRRRARNGVTWVPAFARNPGAITGQLTKGFDLSTIKKTVPVIGGFFSAKLVSDLIAAQGFVPAFLKSGVGRTGLDLLSVGLVYSGAKAVGSKVGIVGRNANNLLNGGGVYVMTKVIYNHVLPLLRYTPLKGLADYLTVSGAASAQPLGAFGELGCCDNGIADYNDYSGLDGMQDVAGEELDS